MFFKNKVQDLIYQKILSFTEEKPNVRTNSLPTHNGPEVSAVIEEDGTESVREVADVKTPMTMVVEKLRRHGFLEGIHDNCVAFDSGFDNYVVLKECVQVLMNQGSVQFFISRVEEEVFVIETIMIIYRKKSTESLSRQVQPINICVVGPFPYQNVKVVPWRYDTTTYVGGNKIQFYDVEIVNIVGTGGMTCNGHVFSPKYTPKVSSSLAVVPSKEKFVSTPPSREGASVSTTLVVTIIPSMTKGTPRKTAKAETPKDKEMVMIKHCIYQSHV